ncbi:coenzyme-B sulfoethylthiotransferase subunit gamma [Methanonatronarchaeum sp. AMET6-2]|uniref:coenzyme-B sulfoethylthiotransferase subunit gamma n=1 Tax=Methanonatronarchaeum sp. AMET6-2 TaxID=2933293 RepID=UPI0012051E5A|nr:coenzyme-B sulfoethylthiotransferase subunit gamma [Methanonatronarchaeum sp. AMET6-2]RZN61135.1 MAG: coenzyme-B sulfoethylthiotransferase subunit gamma [Methanonatronarchaeia archaeon]UOY09807.1 coenzyme-B sulfoethylthiotransferase subunit gamma [Methanonatronarchaeum sp. AMET6-2]
MSYEAQRYPGSTQPAKNRRKYMDPDYELEKLREISEDDVTILLSHREPGEAFKSVHPPLDELDEPDCPIREMVEPTEGTKAGDRIRYVQFTDSVYNAPLPPFMRAFMYMTRYRGIDTGTLSGRQVIEARERDVEKISQELLTTEVFDPAKTGLRGATVHGHAVRLDENGLMFDALQRYKFNEETGEVEYVKDMIGVPLDEPITFGKPMDDEDLLERTSIFREDGTPFSEDEEVVSFTQRLHKLRTLVGYDPSAMEGE